MSFVDWMYWYLYQILILGKIGSGSTLNPPRIAFQCSPLCWESRFVWRGAGSLRNCPVKLKLSALKTCSSHISAKGYPYTRCKHVQPASLCQHFKFRKLLQLFQEWVNLIPMAHETGTQLYTCQIFEMIFGSFLADQIHVLDCFRQMFAIM